MWANQLASLSSASHCVWPMKRTQGKLEEGGNQDQGVHFPRPLPVGLQQAE